MEKHRLVLYYAGRMLCLRPQLPRNAEKQKGVAARGTSSLNITEYELFLETIPESKLELKGIARWGYDTGGIYAVVKPLVCRIKSFISIERLGAQRFNGSPFFVQEVSYIKQVGRNLESMLAVVLLLLLIHLLSKIILFQ